MAEIEFAKVTLTANGTNARTLTAQLRMNGQEGDDDNAEPADNCEILQPLGLIAKPTIAAGKYTEAAYVQIGDEIVVLGLIEKSQPAMTLEDGETRVYGASQPTAVIRFRANGDIEITPASGQNVILNGGTAQVGRVGDQVQVTIPAGSLTLAVSGGSATGPAAPLTVTGQINAGAPNVKA